MSAANTMQTMRERLAALQAQQLDIIDDSALHAGHEGAKSGGGHYRMLIVTRQFSGRSTLARHRMVYAALGSMMQREIHALNIVAKTPDEAEAS